MDTPGDPFSTQAVPAAYDVAARDYAAAFGDDLAQLPSIGRARRNDRGCSR